MKSMEIIDANIALRYLLNDHEVFSEKSAKILENNNIHLTFEVCAEIVYVLEKVYNIPRKDIQDAVTTLIEYPNINTPNEIILKTALKIYVDSNIDFVDSILVAYNQISGAIIHSFDKKVNKLCK
jgi:predicted nucleic-acid-binding protein